MTVEQLIEMLQEYDSNAEVSCDVLTEGIIYAIEGVDERDGEVFLW